MSDDPELDGFKRNVDLREYAAGFGYALDKHDSWRGSAVMRDGRDDKIVIKRDHDGHFVYFSVRDDRDNGSIVDFLMRRRQLNLGQIRKELRAWTGGGAAAVWAPMERTPKDRLQVERRYRAMQDAPRHPYLEEARGLSPALLSSPRFAGRIRIDGHRNAVFPHFDAAGLCGYELKNKDFTGFAAGGQKGLWASYAMPDDRRLVIAESAIDALSHAALFPDAQSRYASIGGKPNPMQPSLLLAVVKRLAPGSEVVAAMDNDADGVKLAAMVGEVVREAGRADLSFRVHSPSLPCKDWNDVLRKPMPVLWSSPSP